MKAYGLIFLTTFSTIHLCAQDDYWKNYKAKSDNAASSNTAKSNPKQESSIDSQTVKTNYSINTQQSYREKALSIYSAPELTSLSEKFKNENLANPKIKGYKVQIFFGERGSANGLKAEFENSYPDMNAEVSYLAPNFRVRVGNFRTQLDAERFTQSIKGIYSSAYIVPEDIDLPNL